MKVASYTISYQGLWYAGPPIPLKEVIPKVAEFGYDGISLSGKRVHASPLDMDKKACKEIKELAKSHKLELVAIDTYSNFMDPVTEHREAQLVWLREIMKLANDLDMKIVKIFPGWTGTTIRNGRGAYEHLYRLWRDLPYFTSLEIWNWIKECLKEVSKWADDYGVDLALQNHPPLGAIDTGRYEPYLQMVKEVNEERLKMCLDVPLFPHPECQTDEYIAKAVENCGDLIIYSHFGGNFEEKSDGTVIQKPLTWTIGEYATNYLAYVRELKKIGYKGYFANEVCGPVLVNHEYKGKDEVYRIVRLGCKYMKQVIAKA